MTSPNEPVSYRRWRMAVFWSCVALTGIAVLGLAFVIYRVLPP